MYQIRKREVRRMKMSDLNHLSRYKSCGLLAFCKDSGREVKVTTRYINGIKDTLFYSYAGKREQESASEYFIANFLVPVGGTSTYIEES